MIALVTDGDHVFERLTEAQLQFVTNFVGTVPADTALVLGPVTTSAYLQRPQIATRAAANRIVYSRQARWAELGLHRTDLDDESRPPYYVLTMYDYPSGDLHIGHWFVKTPTDAIARHKRMSGYNVFFPVGFDAFGLPAENAAIKSGVQPRDWTMRNIDKMRRQLRTMGAAWDWDAEVITCNPDYYRWNQWFFLRMLERGIAYKKTGVVNWDPVDQTVLANEQVIEGRGWRTGALVEKREIPMYFLRITAYAEELLAALDKLPGWPEQVKLMQKNWIGRSEGVRIGFPYELDGKKQTLWVFTTRADTLMGTTFMAVAAEHPIAVSASRTNPELKAFVEECKKGAVMEADLAQIEKKGMPTGLHVFHPTSNEKIPVWVGNYVLMGYGEGAVMGVPAHDERDYAFALQYRLEIKPVIRHPLGDTVPPPWKPEYAEHGVNCLVVGYNDEPGPLAREVASDPKGIDPLFIDLVERWPGRARWF